MSNMTPIRFDSAYRILTPAEKAFVDDYVEGLERLASRNNESITVTLTRPVPQETVQASKGLLHYPTVQYAIRERVLAIAEAADVDTRRVIKELSSIAFSNINNYLDICPITGKPTYRLGQCTPEEMAAVKKIEHEITATGAERMKFETHDKLKAIDMILRVKGLYVDDNEWVEIQRRNDKKINSTIQKGADASEEYAKFIGKE